MNLSCKIASTNESNSFISSACNNTEMDKDFDIGLATYTVTILMSFPLNSYVIWLIVRGTGNGLAAEFFIFNFSICEIFYCIECFLVTLSYVFESVSWAVYFLDGIAITGRPLFQCLICVERYLAVVRPVIFLKLKPLRYRIMCSAVAWMICFCSCIFNFMLWLFLLDGLSFISYFLQFVIFVSIKFLCCMAVLRVLKQSGPGERGREEENHMKKRAFNLILITIVTMLIIYTPQIILVFFVWSSNLHFDVLQPVSNVFFLIAGLVQPLFFLYRVGKLNFIKCQ